MSQLELTCVVPTHNRPHFLRRLLHFYTKFRPNFPLIIVDSSNPSNAAENRAVIDCVRDRLEISYQHYDLPFIEKCIQCLERVWSPLVVLCADDDFLFPEGVEQCREFLLHEAGYASAMGRTVLLDNTRSGWRGKLRVLKGYSIEHDQPLSRCRQLAAQFYSNFYAVYHTATLLENYRIAAASSDAQSLPHLPETLLSQLSVLRGRCKVLPVMYSLWERHETNWSSMTRTQIQPEADLKFERFKQCLTDQFGQVGIEPAQTERLVEHWYGHFRFPDLANRRRQVSTAEMVRRVVYGMAERAVDTFANDRVMHCRSVRSSDLVGCEGAWNTAVKLMTEFPTGMTANHPDAAQVHRSNYNFERQTADV